MNGTSNKMAIISAQQTRIQQAKESLAPPKEILYKKKSPKKIWKEINQHKRKAEQLKEGLSQPPTGPKEDGWQEVTRVKGKVKLVRQTCNTYNTQERCTTPEPRRSTRLLANTTTHTAQQQTRQHGQTCAEKTNTPISQKRDTPSVNETTKQGHKKHTRAVKVDRAPVGRKRKSKSTAPPSTAMRFPPNHTSKYLIG